MDIKKYLKTDKLKISIAILMFFAPLILQFFINANRDNEAYGFPLPIIQRVTYQCMLGGSCPEPHYVFNGISLVVNAVFLYLITLLIVSLFKKLLKPIKNNLVKSGLLTSILFLIFTIISFIFSIGYPLIKVMVGIGLPLIFYAYDPWTGPGIQLGSFFLWRYLLIDIIYWFVISVIIIWIFNRLDKIKLTSKH